MGAGHDNTREPGLRGQEVGADLGEVGVVKGAPPSFAFPEGFDWHDPETWPDEFRELFEWAARVAYIGLVAEGKKMLDCRIEGTDEPVTMLFAIGERAEELRRAWRSVYAIHNEGLPRE